MSSCAVERGISVTRLLKLFLCVKWLGEGHFRSSRLCTGLPSICDSNLNFDSPYPYKCANSATASLRTVDS